MQAIKNTFQGKTFAYAMVFFLLLGAFAYLPTPTAYAGIKDDVSGWAWSKNIGWISFNSSDCDPNGDGKFNDGGDPNLSPNCPQNGSDAFDYGVNIDRFTGNMSGYAWNPGAGWISFNSSDVSTCGAAGVVDLNLGTITGWARFITADSSNNSGNWNGCINLSSGKNTGVFSSPDVTAQGGMTYLSSGSIVGYAWASEVGGWINFYDVKVANMSRPYISIHPHTTYNTGVKIETPLSTGSSGSGVGLTEINQPFPVNPVVDIETQGMKVGSCTASSSTHTSTATPYTIPVWDSFVVPVDPSGQLMTGQVSFKLKALNTSPVYNQLYDTHIIINCTGVDNKSYSIDVVLREIYNKIILDLKSSAGGFPLPNANNTTYPLPFGMPNSTPIQVYVHWNTQFLDWSTCNASLAKQSTTAPTGGSAGVDTVWNSAVLGNQNDFMKVSFQPVGTYTYTLSCKGLDGNPVPYTDTTTVNILSGGIPPATVTLFASPPTISVGDSPLVNWSTSDLGATSYCEIDTLNTHDTVVSANNANWGTPAVSSTTSLWGTVLNLGGILNGGHSFVVPNPITQSITYAIKCTDANGIFGPPATLTINPVPLPPPNITANTGTGTVMVNYGDTPTIQWSRGGGALDSCYIGPSNTYDSTSTPQSVAINNTAVWEQGAPTIYPYFTQTLLQNYTNSVKDKKLGGGSPSGAISGQFITPNPITVPVTYALYCTNNGVKGPEASVNIDINKPVVTISAATIAPLSGTTTVITWSSTNAATCEIGPSNTSGTNPSIDGAVWTSPSVVGGNSSLPTTPVIGGTVPNLGGSFTTLPITQPVTYAIQCENNGNTAQSTVTLIPPPTVVITATDYIGNFVPTAASVPWNSTPTIEWQASPSAISCRIGQSNTYNSFFSSSFFNAYWTSPAVSPNNSKPLTPINGTYDSFVTPNGLVSTMIYAVQCQDANGNWGAESTVVVTPNLPPTVSLTITDGSGTTATSSTAPSSITIEAGDQPTISWWSSAYTDHCDIGPTNSTDPSKPNLFGALWDGAFIANNQQTSTPGTLLTSGSTPAGIIGSFTAPTPITTSVTYAIQCFDSNNNPSLGSGTSITINVVKPTVIIYANGVPTSTSASDGTTPTISWTSTGTSACDIGPANTNGAYWPTNPPIKKNGLPPPTMWSQPGGNLLPAYIANYSFQMPIPISIPVTYDILCTNQYGYQVSSKVQIGVNYVPPTATITADGIPTYLAVNAGDTPTIAITSANAKFCRIGPSNTNPSPTTGALWASSVVGNNGDTSVPLTFLTNGGYFLNGSFVVPVPITGTVTYAVVCYGGQNGPLSNPSPEETVTISVKPTVTISATDSSGTTATTGGTLTINAGEQPTITWSSTNATSCTIGPSNTVGGVSRGMATGAYWATSHVYPSTTPKSTQKLTLNGTNGRLFNGTFVAPYPINASSPVVYGVQCKDQYGNWSVEGTVTLNILPLGVTISASPLPYDVLNPIAISWVGTNVTSCKIGATNTAGAIWPDVPLTISPASSTPGQTLVDGGLLPGTGGTMGTFNLPAGSLTSTIRYAVQCVNVNNIATNQASVQIVVNPAPTVTISSSSTTVTSGDTSTITWTASGASSCEIGTGNTSSNNGAAGAVWPSTELAGGPIQTSTPTAALANFSGTNSFTTAVPITGPTTYAITCYNMNNIATTQSVSIGVLPFPTVSITATHNGISSTPNTQLLVSDGDRPTITWSSTNATSCRVGPTMNTTGGIQGKSAFWDSTVLIPPQPTTDVRGTALLSVNDPTGFQIPYGMKPSQSPTVYSIQCVDKNGNKSNEASAVIALALSATMKVDNTATAVSINNNSVPTVSWDSAGALRCEIGPGNTGEWDKVVLGTSNNRTAPGTPITLPQLPLLNPGTTGSFPAPNPITQPVVYAVRCYDTVNAFVDSNVQVTINPLPTAVIEANGQTGTVIVNSGDTPTITWSSTGASYCTIGSSQNTLGAQGYGAYWDTTVLSGNIPNTDAAGTLLFTTGTTTGFTVPYGILGRVTYAIQCYDSNIPANASSEATVTIDLTLSARITANGTDTAISIPKGSQATIAWSSTGATRCEIGPSNTKTSTGGNSAYWAAGVASDSQLHNAPHFSFTLLGGTPPGTKNSFTTPYGILIPVTYAVQCYDSNGNTIESTVIINPTVPVPSISANPSIVVPNATTQVTWSVTNATSCYIGPGNTAGAIWPLSELDSVSTSPTAAIGTKLISASNTPRTFSTPGIGANETYDIRCIDSAPTPNQATASITISTLTASISSSSVLVDAGDKPTITWSSTGANYCEIGPGNTQGVQGYGAYWDTSVTPNNTTPTDVGGAALLGTGGNFSVPYGILGPVVYTVQCYDANNVKSNEATVTVNVKPVGVTISASPLPYDTTQPTTITWWGVNVTACEIDGANTTGAVWPSNTQYPTVATATDAGGTPLIGGGTLAGTGGTAGAFDLPAGSLTSTVTYAVKCLNQNNLPVNASVQIVVNPPPVVTITSPDATVTSGDTPTITWTSTGATYCKIDPLNTSPSAATGAVWSGTYTSGTDTSAPGTTLSAVNGSFTAPVPVTGPVTYAVICYNVNNIATNASVLINVYPFPVTTITATYNSVSGNPLVVPPGAKPTISWSATNAATCIIGSMNTFDWDGTAVSDGTQSSAPGKPLASTSGSFATPIGINTPTETYSVQCFDKNSNPSNEANVVINKIVGGPPTVTISTNAPVVSAGGNTTIQWSSSAPATCTIGLGNSAGALWPSSELSGNPPATGVGGTNLIGSSGTFTFTTPSITPPVDYEVTCQNQFGTDTASVHISLEAPVLQDPSVVISANNFTGNVSVVAGDPLTITWSPQNANACEVDSAYTFTSGSWTDVSDINNPVVIATNGGDPLSSATGNHSFSAPPLNIGDVVTYAIKCSSTKPGSSIATAFVKVTAVDGSNVCSVTATPLTITMYTTAGADSVAPDVSITATKFTGSAAWGIDASTATFLSGLRITPKFSASTIQQGVKQYFWLTAGASTLAPGTYSNKINFQVNPTDRTVSCMTTQPITLKVLPGPCVPSSTNTCKHGSPGKVDIGDF